MAEIYCWVNINVEPMLVVQTNLQWTNVVVFLFFFNCYVGPVWLQTGIKSQTIVPWNGIAGTVKMLLSVIKIHFRAVNIAK